MLRRRDLLIQVPTRKLVAERVQEAMGCCCCFVIIVISIIRTVIILSSKHCSQANWKCGN